MSDISQPTTSSNGDIPEDKKEEATKVKAQANDAFKSHDFPHAAALYGDAIQLNPMDPTLWCNRAFARMKLEEYGFALEDAARAIALNPKYSKAYYRRAQCHLQMLKPQLAVADLRKVHAMEPANAEVKSQLTMVQKLVQKIQFEKAIEVEAPFSRLEKCLDIIATGGCEIPQGYAGPMLETLEGGKYRITAAFIVEMIEWFKADKTLPRRIVWEIILGAHEYFKNESTLESIDIQKGMTCDVIGDTHGQLYDLLRLYSLTGEPSDTHCLLMNGDLVDRGSWSVEVILISFAYKWLRPKQFFINRGNHEAKDMNRQYGFRAEVEYKHDKLTFELFSYVFTTLPLATLINATEPPPETKADVILSPEGRKRYFVVHGGLPSTEGVTLDEIRAIRRVDREPDQNDLMNQLLWTDPQVLPGYGRSQRGPGKSFGPDITKRWCILNGVTGIIRSHEVRQNGYDVQHDGLCTTVFSAPNYVDQMGNQGAFIRIDSAGTQDYIQFKASPHPPKKPMAYVTGGLASMMF